MVALPVTGLVGIAVVADSMYNPTVQERITTELGNTEARLTVTAEPGSGLRQNPDHPDWYEVGPVGEGELVSPRDALPAGTRLLALTTTVVTATTATGIATFPAREGPSWDSSFAGKYDVTEGRSPRSDREVMVTAAALPRLGVEVGDTVELQGSGQSSVTIVGILDDHTLPDAAEQFYARSGALSGATAGEDVQNATFYLPDTEVNWETIKSLNNEGITVLSRSVLLKPPPADGSFPEYNQWGSFFSVLVPVVIIAGFAAFEVILLAGAAFTVTARQQQRTLATIASVGAPRKLLFRILTANGIVLGAIGGLAGAILGTAAAFGFMFATADGSSTQYYGFHVPWLALLAAIVFAVLIGWIASLAPARNASRFDVVAALRGARKPPSPNARRPIVGLIMLVVGIALAIPGGILLAFLTGASSRYGPLHPLLWLPLVMLVVGPILAQLGLALCGPLVLRLIANVTRRSGIGTRMAARDAARNPSRAVPAFSAIMTTVFVAVFGMSLLTSGQENARINYQYMQPLGTVTAQLVSSDRDDSGALVVTEYAHPSAVVDAFRNSIDVDQLEILATVPDPPYDYLKGEPVDLGGTTDPHKSGFPVPDISPQNRCPAWPNSPELTPANQDFNTAEGRAAIADWRCGGQIWSYFQRVDTNGGHIYVGNVDGLALALGREPSDEARRTLASGGAVSFYQQYVQDGGFSISWWAPEEAYEAALQNDVGSPLRTETIDAVVELPEHPNYFGVFISEATAKRLGLEYRDSTVIASTLGMPTTEQSDALSQAMLSLPDNDGGFNQQYFYIERGPDSFAGPFVWGLLLLAVLIAVASATVAIGLARFDGRQDDATLSALGAGRLVRKNFAFWQAVIIAGVGTVLGAIMGLVPAIALGAMPDWPFAPPWLQISLVIVALPLVIACGSWLLATRNKVSARRVAIA